MEGATPSPSLLWQLLASGAFNYNPRGQNEIRKPQTNTPVDPHADYGRRISRHKCAGAFINVKLKSYSDIFEEQQLATHRLGAGLGRGSSSSSNNNNNRDNDHNDHDDEEYPDDEWLYGPRLIKRRRDPTNLMDLPAEVRIEIYKFMLANDGPILVAKNWMDLHKGSAPGRGRSRSRPAFCKNILLVSRQIYAEALPVLYAVNEFEYVVREGMSAPSHHPPGAFTSTEKPNEVDPDYGSVAAGRVTSRTRSKALTTNDKDSAVAGQISFNKYAHLIRRVSVAIESNRTGAQYKHAMAHALWQFANRAKGPNAVQLHTLTMRLYPMREEYGITHVSFFEAESEVMEALAAVPTQHLRIRIGTSQLSLDPSTGLEIRFDMRCCLFQRQSQAVDGGEHELRGAVQVRNLRVTETLKRLRSLSREIIKVCRAAEYYGESPDSSGSDLDDASTDDGMMDIDVDDDDQEDAVAANDDMDMDVDDLFLGPNSLPLSVMPISEEVENFVIREVKVEVDYSKLEIKSTQPTPFPQKTESTGHRRDSAIG